MGGLNNRQADMKDMHTPKPLPAQFYNVKPAAEFARALRARHPVVMFVSSELNSMPDSLLQQIRQYDCRVIAVVNTERPVQQHSTDKMHVWNPSTLVEQLVDCPEVAAILYRSKETVRNNIAKFVDAYTSGFYFPPEQLDFDYNRDMTLAYDMVLLSYCIKPKWVVLEQNNVVFTCVLRELFFETGFDHQFCDKSAPFYFPISHNETILGSNHVNVYWNHRESQASFYNYRKCEYVGNYLYERGGCWYTSDHNRCLEDVRNTIEHHPCYNIGKIFQYYFECRQFYKQIKYIVSPLNCANAFNGLAKYVTGEFIQGSQPTLFSVDPWFLPRVNLQKYASVLIHKPNKGFTVGKEYWRYQLYRFTCPAGMRMTCILKE